MSAPLRRTARHPVRVVHLGLGAFHRAHQAWYTQRANDAAAQQGDETEGWGIAAFTGRSPEAARLLSNQDALYTLLVRGAADEQTELIQSLSMVADGGDAEAWRNAVSDPVVGTLTLTITEAGYRPPASELDADLKRLRAWQPAVTAPGRVVDGLRARREGGAGAIAVVSCDNLPRNGQVTRDAVVGLALRVDAQLARWIESEVSFVSTMVDRITPATTDADRTAVVRLTGAHDASPVVAEPFSEWVLSGEFPAGRPAWDAAGALFVDDIEPFERRKLWLLNAGHSLLAYLGLLRGHATVAEAMADPVCANSVELLWAEARTELPFEDAQVDEALAAVRNRFSNARIEHNLAQIAADGSQKLGPRIVDPLRSRLEADRSVGTAQATTIAAWILHLLGNSFRDAAAGSLFERLRALGARQDDTAVVVETLLALAADLAEDERVVQAVRTQLASLRATGTPADDGSEVHEVRTRGAL